MSNPAYQRLVGYTAKELSGMNVTSLTAPQFAEAAKEARAKQFRDGEHLEILLETVTKSGRHIPVLVTSEILKDTQDLRIVTLLRCKMDASPQPDADLWVMRTSNVGQLHAVSIAAYKSQFGDAWESVSFRVMLTVEQVIKRRLASRDVFSRSDDGFMVWFESQDAGRNEACLERIVREVRLRLLQEFGDEKSALVCAHITSAMVKTTEETSSPKAFNDHRERTSRAAERPSKVTTPTARNVRWDVNTRI